MKRRNSGDVSLLPDLLPPKSGSAPPGRRTVGLKGRRAPPGFTLIEIVVVLALLLLMSGLVAPSILSRPDLDENAVQRVIDEARRGAVRRAASLTLEFEPDGRWVAGSGSLGGGPGLSGGTLEWRPPIPFRLHISPLGACTLEIPAGQPDPSLTLDLFRCRLRGGARP